MALDGLFLHHLIDEIKEFTEGKKIYKIDPLEIELRLWRNSNGWDSDRKSDI